MNYHQYTKAELAHMLSSLEKEYQKLQVSLEAQTTKLQGIEASCECRYELFKPFIDDGRSPRMLIDTAYRISYINDNAVELMGADIRDSACGRNIFDLSKKIGEALKLKNTIDKAFMQGEEETVHIRTICMMDDDHIPVRVSATRVRYNDHPAVCLQLQRCYDC